MSASLGQQWLVVQFGPDTTVAAARHITQACSHVPNLLPLPVKPATGAAGLVDQARYDATKATDADMAELQRCLQRFPSVRGVSLTEPGDS